MPENLQPECTTHKRETQGRATHKKNIHPEPLVPPFPLALKSTPHLIINNTEVHSDKNHIAGLGCRCISQIQESRRTEDAFPKSS